MASTVEQRRGRHRVEVRESELAWVRRHLDRCGVIIELGTGSGRQAAALEADGHVVIGVDLPHGPYSGNEVRPPVLFDGVDLPIRGAVADVVFSLHVLEHVESLGPLLVEAARVVDPRGVVGSGGPYGVHVMPTPTWRAATLVMRYVALVVGVARRVGGRVGAVRNSGSEPGPTAGLLRGGPTSDRPGWRRYLIPSPHGIGTSAWAEVVTFSEPSWHRRITAAGWEVVAVHPSRLVYSGYHVLGARISLRQRRRLSYVLGSSSKLWLLRPSAGTWGEGWNPHTALASPGCAIL